MMRAPPSVAERKRVAERKEKNGSRDLNCKVKRTGSEISESIDLRI
jgi:hypothetical protein